MKKKWSKGKLNLHAYMLRTASHDAYLEHQHTRYYIIPIYHNFQRPGTIYEVEFVVLNYIILVCPLLARIFFCVSVRGKVLFAAYFRIDFHSVSKIV